MSCNGLTTFYDFNPRSREGSDVATVYKTMQYDISIHAPARGATLTFKAWKIDRKFQSTLPRGERQNRLVNLLAYCLISIHAPARGATNPDHGSLRGMQFQSTLPRGERLTRYNDDKADSNFNPRSREGSDGLQKYL